MLLTHRTMKSVAVLLATYLLSTTASAVTILRYTDHEPLGGMRTSFIKEVFFSAIEKESAGRLKIEEHWNGETATSYEALQVTANGDRADMAIVVPEYTPDKLPLHQIFKSFPVGPSGDKQVEFFRRVYAEIPAFPSELEKNNLINIFLSTGYPVAFFSTRPLNSLNDLQGGRWRSASFWHQDFLRNAGAEPVSMPWGEGIYAAMKQGTLDGLMVNVDGGYMLNVHQAAPEIVVSKDLWMGHVYLLVMNKQTWNSLAAEDQAAIGRAAEIAYRKAGSVMDKSFSALVAEIKHQGMNIRIATKKELTDWETATKYQQLQSVWLKEQQSKGIADVAAVLQGVSRIFNQVLASTPSQAED